MIAVAPVAIVAAAAGSSHALELFEIQGTRKRSWLRRAPIWQGDTCEIRAEPSMSRTIVTAGAEQIRLEPS
ncbi:MAG: hypothetical protein KGL39_54805 [Patescibacteria group bacterium]|nr:hypothetical protein [Patescibacteria group bacterium]